MAISKARKDELVAQYVDLLNQSDAIFITEYKGMSVKQLQELRTSVRESGGVFHITKNTLLKVALDETESQIPAEILKGQIATGFALGEAPALAKALTEYAKKEDVLVIQGGLMDNNVLNADDVKALASLPSMDQLRAQILGLINAPATNIVSTVTSGVRQLVNVVDAYAKKDGESDEASAEAASADAEVAA